MAKNKELRSYGGYITKEQEDKLLIYCEKNKITKARAIGLFIDSLDLDSLDNKNRELETLKLDFTEYKESAISEVKVISQRLYEIEKILYKLEKNETVIELENSQHENQSEIGNKGITITELSKLLNRSVWTIRDHKKDIKSYTKQLIGQAYKYNVKTKLFYKTNA